MIAFNDGRGLVKIIKRGDQDLVFQTLGNASGAAYRAWQLARWLPFGAHHSVVMAAMEGPFEFQDFVTTTKGPRHPQGKKRRLSPRGRKAHLFGTRHGVDNGVSQPDGLFMEIKKGRALVELLLDCCHHLRVGMSENHRTRAAQVINHTVPFHDIDPCNLAYRNTVGSHWVLT